METRFRESVRRPWRAPVGEGARRLVGRATCEVGSAGAGPSGRPGDARAAGFSFKWALNWQKMPDYDIRGFPWGGAGCPSTHTPMLPWLENAQVRRVLHFPQLDGRLPVPLRPPLGTAQSGIFCHFLDGGRKTVGNTREPPGPEGGAAPVYDIRDRSGGHGQKTIGSGNMTRQGPPIAYGFPPYNASEMQITIDNGNADRQLPMPPCRYLWIPA